METNATVQLAEVVAVLAEHGALRCVPEVQTEDGWTVVTLRVTPGGPDGQWAVAEVYHAVAYLRDMAQLRFLAMRYDIDPVALEALLPRDETDVVVLRKESADGEPGDRD